MTAAAALGSQCPNCAGWLQHANGAPSWCPECEWNLGIPDRGREGRLTRWNRRVAVRQSLRDFERLRGQSAPRPGRDLARVASYLLAVVVHGITVALLFGGAWLLVHDPDLVTVLLGMLLIAMAVALRPRVGRLDPDARVLERDSAPTLFALVDEVGASIGAPPPALIAVDDDVNASFGPVGLRRRQVLTIGAPLWMVLGPQQRVALLAHELGHGINGDSRHGAVVGSALETLEEWYALLTPSPDRTAGSFVAFIGELVAAALQRTVRVAVTAIRLALLVLVQRSGQRAEYLADDMSARAGSTEAAVAAADVLLVADTCHFLMQVASRRSSEWHELVENCRPVLRLPRSELERRRRLSVHLEAGLSASHPPSGLRAALLESRPARTAAHVLSRDRSARIDAELAAEYARTIRELRRS